MFTIIGGDGKEYGPVTADQIRAWITAGRANLDTRAKALGSDEWRFLRDYPEFSPTPAAEAAEPPLVQTDLAERESRLFARMIDWCIRILGTLPGALMLGPVVMRALFEVMRTQNFNPDVFDTPRAIAGAWVLLLSMTILFVVQLVLLTVRGQSLGKMAMGVRIVRAVDGSNAGFVRAWLLREFVPGLLGVVPVIGPLVLSPVFFLVDCCFIFRADRRCVHDHIAGTVVVKVQKQS